MSGNPIRVSKEISKEWERLMHIVESLGKGRIEIVVNEGKPVQAEVIVQKIKLDGEEENEFKAIRLK